MTPAKARFLKLWAYSTFFWLAFTTFFYLTFPVDRVKGIIVEKIEEALGKGKQGPYGVDPKVTIGMLSMWRLSGLDAKNVQIQLGSRDPDPGPTIDVDRLQARVGILSLLTDDKSISFSADLYDGEAEGAFVVDPKGNVLELELDVEGVDLAKAPLLVGKLGVPATGALNLKADLDLGKEAEKNAQGKATIDVQKISLGPGELKIPLPGLTGGLTLPLIDMGDLKGEIDVKDGKGKFEKLKLDGKSISGELSGEIALRGRIGTSRLDGAGWLKISEQFLDENSKFKTLLEFPGPLQKAKDEEGRYHFTLKGTLASPSGALARDAGKKASSPPRPPKPARPAPPPAAATPPLPPATPEPAKEAEAPKEPEPPKEAAAEPTPPEAKEPSADAPADEKKEEPASE